MKLFWPNPNFNPAYLRNAPQGKGKDTTMPDRLDVIEEVEIIMELARKGDESAKQRLHDLVSGHSTFGDIAYAGFDENKVREWEAAMNKYFADRAKHEHAPDHHDARKHK